MQKKFAYKAIAAALLVSLSGTASALSDQWYIGIGGGISQLQPETTASSVGLDDENGQVGTLYFGKDFDSRSSGQFQLYSLGESSYDDGQSTASYIGGDASLLYRFYDSRDRRKRGTVFGTAFYGRFGFGFLNRDSDLPLEDDTPVYFGAGAGLETYFTHNIGVRLEALYHETDVATATLTLVTRFGGHRRRPAVMPSPVTPAEPEAVTSPVSKPAAVPVPQPAPTLDPATLPEVATVPPSQPSSLPEVATVPPSQPSSLPEVATVPPSQPSSLPEVATVPLTQPSALPDVATAPSPLTDGTTAPAVTSRPSLPDVASLPSTPPVPVPLPAQDPLQQTPPVGPTPGSSALPLELPTVDTLDPGSEVADQNADYLIPEVEIMGSTEETTSQSALLPEPTTSTPPLPAPSEPQPQLPADSDGDGVSDAKDRCPGSHPGYPVSTRGCPLYAGLLPDLTFQDGSAEFDNSSYPVLDRLAQTLKDYPNAYIEIVAHTDNSGTEQTQSALTRQRLRSIGLYLVNHGISQDRLLLRSYGGKRPAFDNATADGRRRNNRIEIFENP